MDVYPRRGGCEFQSLMLPGRRDVHHEMGCTPPKVLQIVQCVAFRLAGNEARLTVRARIRQNLHNLAYVIEIELRRWKLGRHGVREGFYGHR